MRDGMRRDVDIERMKIKMQFSRRIETSVTLTIATAVDDAEREVERARAILSSEF